MAAGYYSFGGVNSSIWFLVSLKNDVKSVQSQFEEVSGTHLGQVHGLVLSAFCNDRRRYCPRLVDTAAVGNEISCLASTLFLHCCRNRILFLVEVDATRQVGNSSKTT
jgi:hypothetical protein